ncbi:PREDICTED: uncharacterized protein LOC109228101 [Nicotiana attenuata]|uniref:uncharacterized protein LOC109228101 n=1 Tax=Nicotiana attenuata TaxID=49451 RepID=UPI000904E13E|nr:PREDICTED: uncharacterized protein LOC109228101 [Nicotiana attenuata]
MLVKDGKAVHEKVVPVVNVDEQAEEEPSSLTHKSSSEKFVKKSGDKTMKESGGESDDEEVENSGEHMHKKSMEKGKSIYKSIKRKVDDDVEPCTIKKAKVGESLSSEKEKLRNQKLLWGRIFAPDIVDLATEYELFTMKDDESIQDMHTRFTSIINELHSLGDIIPRNNLVRKILSVLPSSWESKVNAITEAKDLQALTIDELQDQYKNNSNKAAKSNSVLDKHFKRKNATDNVVKQALVAWGDSSSKSEEENDHGDSSMMARNLRSYCPKKLMSLANVLIDAYRNLLNDKDALTVELGEAEQSRDDLVVVVVDLKETIKNLKKEKDALDEKVANIEHERDDLLVVVVDLKETIG